MYKKPNQRVLSMLLSKWLGHPHSMPPMRLCLLFRYQGITYNNGRWFVYIHEYNGSAGVIVHLGCYIDEEKAASAYDRAQIFKVGMHRKFVVCRSHVVDVWQAQQQCVACRS